MKQKIVIIAGPTAVGKTEYALAIAQALGGEIVSADSMQLYRYMDIGSAKPTQEELAQVKHHLVDEIDPREDFSVAKYQKLAKYAIFKILAANKIPVISGGTGLYINSLIYDMDFAVSPKQEEYRKSLEKEAAQFGNEFLHNKLKQLDAEAAQRIHPNNVKKVIRALEVVESTGKGMKSFTQSFVKMVDYDYILIGLDRERSELYERINRRVDLLVAKGLVDEIRQLMRMGLSENNISMKGIGYKELIGYLNGEYSLEQAIYLVKRNTRHYAKRQLTWFRRYEDIHWFHLSEDQKKQDSLKEIYRYIDDNLLEKQIE